jgi:hypothetical protein
MRSAQEPVHPVAEGTALDFLIEDFEQATALPI